MKTQTNNYRFTLQKVSDHTEIPSRYYFQRWVTTALNKHVKKAELTIRIVDTAESTALNQRYRNKKYPTNVLSFPFEAPPGTTSALLGDLVICAPVIRKEARQQHKALLAHWAHMVIHGTLHLLGYDHIKAREAVIMEKLEISLLNEFGYPNPYIITSKGKKII